MLDVIVIGKGLIGAATAKYLAEQGLSTAVIGPDEPEDTAAHPGVFASHYDQGRITRRLSKDIIWSHLGVASVARYEAIEAASGIRFHHPCGGLFVSQPGLDDNYLSHIRDSGSALAIPFELMTAAEVHRRYPFLTFPDNATCVAEPAPAGYINPRELIQAQLVIANQNGATVVRETVVSLRRSDGIFVIETDKGQSFQASKVVVAAGAFSNCFGLLPQPLSLRIKTETTILAELPAAEVARLSGMPTIIYMIDSPTLRSIYMLPPIQYPDGRVYIKMGCDTASDHYLDSLAAMRNWIISGDSDQQKADMEAAIAALLPGLAADHFHTRRCLITYTESGKPTIDAVADNLYVATGGNGSSAKSSDALGRLAADFTAHGTWPATLDRSPFMARFG